MTLEHAAFLSRVKHSTTEPLRFLQKYETGIELVIPRSAVSLATDCAMGPSDYEQEGPEDVS